MAWGFRRSINLGPLRINASKSGLGYSLGVPGFRVGKDARKRKYAAVSIPGTGIYNRTYLKSTAQTPLQPTLYTLPVKQNNPSITHLRLRRMLGGASAYAAVAIAVYGLVKFILHLI